MSTDATTQEEKTRSASAKTSVVLTHADRSDIVNSQAHGIGRLASMDGHLVINNLGRNIVVAKLADNALHPISIHATTAFPSEDDPSQFDMDFHAFMRVPSSNKLLAFNHSGVIRCFTGLTSIESAQHFNWAGDVEQFFWSNGFLVTSSPSGYMSGDPAIPGVLISQHPFPSALEIAARTLPKEFGDFSTHQIQYQQFLGEWGIVTALSVTTDGTTMVVASGNRIGAFSLIHTDNALLIGEILWDIEVDFHTNWIRFLPDGSNLVAAGYNTPPAHSDMVGWSESTGGGYSVIRTADGATNATHKFQKDLAWGNGGIPLILKKDSQSIIGIDRQANLYQFDFNGQCNLLAASDQQDQQLGIAHMVSHDGAVFCGFNRGGYRLFKFTI